MFPISQSLDDGGHDGGRRRLLANDYAGGGPDSGPAFSDPNTRQRAALVCACRARRNRARADRTAFWGDVLTVIGGVGTVGGGVINGVAATGVDDTPRKTLLTAGLITMGVGALAFGANSALALTKRANTLESGANDQEYAAAVLWNDAAGDEKWSRAWSACVTAEGSDKPSRLESPSGAFVFDAGIAIDAGADAEADGAVAPKASASPHLDDLRGIPATSVDAGK